ncbi:MAG TPA: hypothetical protein VK892_23240 [Pyrinomonadaceae bacterium]|nr:hypothetical protein [Pyrinomonadaceae bacterium]
MFIVENKPFKHKFLPFIEIVYSEMRATKIIPQFRKTLQFIQVAFNRKSRMKTARIINPQTIHCPFSTVH